MWPILEMQRIYNNLTNDLNTLNPRQKGRHFPDHIFKSIFLYENDQISIHISLNYAP